MNPSRVHQIWNMPYPDFVSFIDQENSPPGGESTLSWWIEQAGIGCDSRLLDLACNTGYSSRSIARRTGCRGSGIDLSALAIASAQAAASAPVFDDKLDYRVGDAAVLPWSDAEFSHAVAGCCFGFIEQREQALAETARVLVPGGLLCVATLPYVETPPGALLDELEHCLGYRPASDRTLGFWRQFFESRFDVAATWLEPLPVQDAAQIRDGSIAHMLGHAHRFDTLTPAEREAAFVRLLRDRLVFNENRRYQTCCRWVLRARRAS